MKSDKLLENTMKVLQGKKLSESRPNWSGWDNIAINNAGERQLLLFQLDKVYKVDYYTVRDNRFIDRHVMEVEVSSKDFPDGATDKQIEEYIRKQLPEGSTLDEISYKYQEDEKAMNKRVRQYLGKSKSQVDKEEKEQQEIYYLQDRIYDYERHGRGTQDQYEKDLDRLSKLQGMD